MREDPDQIHMWPDEDICRRKHGGNVYSELANRRTRKSRDLARIYAWVHGRGVRGATANEAELALDICHSTASARFSDLKEDGYLLPKGESRKTVRNCSAGVFVTVGVARRMKMAPPEQLRLFLDGDGGPADG